MGLTIEEIKASVDLPVDTVPVDEWKNGETVIVRGLTAKGWDEYEQEVIDMQKRGGTTNIRMIRLLLVIRTVMNGDGSAVLFSRADLEWLQGKSAIVTNRLYKKARELSGLDADDAKALEKNSEAGRSDVSPST